jgi:hypothetical protein
MHTQPDLYRPMCATTIATQGRLFDPDEPLPVGLSCSACGRPMVRTASGYLSCPMAHGKLKAEPVDDPEPDDEPTPPLPWPQEARRIARLHARRDNYVGLRWRCQCGACSRTRPDGFVPRERRP